MATNYIHSNFVVPVFADAGQSVSLTSVLAAAYGDQYARLGYLWVYDRDPQYMVASDFSYWNLASPKVSEIQVGGVTIPAMASYALPIASALTGVSLVAGNSIFGTIEFAYYDTAHTIANPEVNWVRIVVVPTQFAINRVANPSGGDVARTALHFAAVYSGVLNDNDCGWIADAIALATGAPMTESEYSADPSQNQDGGLWRVAYRASAANPDAHWETRLQPGDIVRLQWKNGTGAGHSFVVVSAADANGRFQVVDNAVSVNGQNQIGLHTVSYESIADPGTITIYRLSADHRNLIQTTMPAATVTGTVLADDIYATGRQVNLAGGDGNDLIHVLVGANAVDGGAGTDTVQYAGKFGDYAITMSGGSTGSTAAVTEIHLNGSTYVADSLLSIERLQFSDESIALDLGLNQAAGKAVLTMGAALGGLFPAQKDWAGIFLRYFDSGASIVDGSNLLVSAGIIAAFAGGGDNTSFVKFIYNNVYGTAPDAATLAALVAPLNAGTTTQGQWMADMALSQANQNHVNLVGYASHGFQYV